MKKRQINILLATFLGTILVVVAVVLVIWLVVIPWFRGLQFNTNREIVNYHMHHGLDPEAPSLVLDGQRIIGVHPRIDPGALYLPASFMQEHIDPFLFWDSGAGVFFASTRYEMLEFTPTLTRYYINGQPHQLNHPVRISTIFEDGAPVGEEIYMPSCLVEGLYPLIIEHHEEYNIVVVTTATHATLTASVTANQANVRVRPDSRAPIITQLERWEEVTLFPQALTEAEFSDGNIMFFAEHGTSILDNPDIIVSESPGNPGAIEIGPFGDATTVEFIRVRTPQGLLGYIAAQDLITVRGGTAPAETHQYNNGISDRPKLLSEWIDNWYNHPPNWPEGVKINMTWESVYHPDGNATRMQTPLHPNLTVVSPTWFRFDSENLQLHTVASRAYVDWAHSQGVYVWPLLFDVNNASARAILMNREARQTVINQLIHYIDTLNLDGINIDIEHLFSAEEGPYKIQFLRELAIPMRQRGSVLSAAVKVPEPWSMFYRRDLIALTVDFVQIMTYDEHWATSPVAGPVASLPWVQRGVTAILEEVPREKLIMGLPFFNRIWREIVLDDESLETIHMGINGGRNFFEERGVEWEWDESAGSYFGQVVVTEDGQTVIYRVWLENERSIAAKMQIYIAHDLAGVSSWRRDLGNQGVKDVVGFHFP